MIDAQKWIRIFETIGFVAIIISLGIGIGWFIRDFQPSSGVTTYQLTLRYGEGRINENFTIPPETFEGMVLPIIFEVNRNETYQIWKGIQRVRFSDGDLNQYYEIEVVAWIRNVSKGVFWVSFKNAGFFGILRLDGGWNQSFVAAIYGSK
jgi:hypothetical protein